MAKLDDKTAELPGLPELPKKRGRPPSGNAKTAAERMRAMRARKANDLKLAKKWFGKTSVVSLLATIQGSVAYNADEQGHEPVTEREEQLARVAWLEIGRRMGWL